MDGDEEPGIDCRDAVRRISEAESALQTSKECQRNGLLVEAVMSTVEALQHIEHGLLMCPAGENQDHLKNLQFKANCLLDCLTRMTASKAKQDELASLTDLLSGEDSGLTEIHVMKATNYRQCDSSQNTIYSLDSGLVVLLLKVVRPRLVYFMQVRTEEGDKIYTIPLREETNICIDKRNLEIQLPDFSIDGLAIVQLSNVEDVDRLTAFFEEFLIPYTINEEVFETQGDTEPGAGYPHRLVRGASLLSLGLKRGAEKTGEFLTWGTPFVISKLAKSDTVTVNDNWRTTANVAKSVTTTAASVSSRFADKLGSTTMAIGRFLAPHAQHAGSRLLVHTAGVDEQEASETVNNVMNFTAGAVTAVATVFEGIEESVKTIGTSIGENSGKIIEHKYGPEAASVATDTFETIGNVYTISKHTKLLQPKGMLKTAAKNTGKGILQEIGGIPAAEATETTASTSTTATTRVIQPNPELSVAEETLHNHSEPKSNN